MPITYSFTTVGCGPLMVGEGGGGVGGSHNVCWLKKIAIKHVCELSNSNHLSDLKVKGLQIIIRKLLFFITIMIISINQTQNLWLWLKTYFLNSNRTHI